MTEQYIGMHHIPAEAGYDYLKNMLDTIADPIFVKDSQHRWVDGNRAFWDLMGGPPDMFLGKTDYDFFPKEQADIFWEKDDLVFATGNTVINEEFLTDREGSIHIISTKKTLFTNPEGERVLVGIIRDITAQKELETLKAAMAERVLSQKEQQYRSIFEATNDAIIIVNMEGKMVEANPAAAAIYGFTPQQFASMHALELCAEADHAKWEQIIQQALSGERYYIESLHRRADGSVMPVDINGSAFLYNEKPHIIAVIRDITERKKAQDSLKEADRRKDEFLAMLAHELRNPLAPISNAVHVMKSTLSGDIRDEAASLVDRQVTQMTHLLNDLLDASRVTLGKIELRRQSIALKELLLSALENTRPLLLERGHTLEADIPEETIRLYADPTRLTQVFSNLLNNAIKYTEPGGHIRLRATQDRLGVTISISDNGIGIDRDMLPCVFDLFTQVDSSMERAQGGLGIGLTLVKHLVEMHKGSVSVTSGGKGQGSEFTVRLPIQIGGQDEKKTVAATPDMGQTAPLRILVVDDNEGSAKTLGWMMEILGHESRIAHDGPEAIREALAFKPHIILLDIGLPGMNGYEVCQHLRAEPSLKHTIIVAQSGWGQKEHIQRSREAGFAHHLVKPVRIETLKDLFSAMRFPDTGMRAKAS